VQSFAMCEVRDLHRIMKTPDFSE